ncbi:MAG: hypothetical protein AAFX58_04870 [Pseudomonadota bacterium]
MSRFSIIVLTLAALSAGAGQVLFKLGARGRTEIFEFLNTQIALGLVFYGLGTLAWIYVLSYEKLVNVYAFTALTFVLVYLAGAFIVGERVTAAGMAGVALILAGLYLISQYNV